MVNLPFTVGDTVNALFYPDIIATGIVAQILNDWHVVVRLHDGSLMSTVVPLCRKV